MMRLLPGVFLLLAVQAQADFEPLDLSPGSPDMMAGSKIVGAAMAAAAEESDGISERLYELGFNRGSLLIGSVAAGGSSLVGEPLEFLFAITPRQAVGRYGDTAGVALSMSGYDGGYFLRD